MPRYSLLPWTLLASIVSFSSLAPAFPLVDPNVVRDLDLRSQSTTLRTHRKGTMTPVFIEFHQPFSNQLEARLRKLGVDFPKRGKKAPWLERYAAAHINRATLDVLRKLPDVKRISSVPPRGPYPLDFTTELLNVPAVQGGYDAIDGITGRGMLVADTDSNADVFHPHFFHGDGGYFDWIDVNGNGVFDPDVDAIDLDGDGQASAHETGRVLFARTYSYYGPVSARSDDFDPGIDWIYLDENGNGKRDYGMEGKFNDGAPAFGEPLFVPDDVNRNGRIDVGERFVRLKTSKFRKVYTSIPVGWVNKTHIYERGVDMSTHISDSGDGNILGSDAVHGTLMLSNLLGDVPLVGRRWVGIAPEAETVLSVDRSGGLGGMMWMLEEKPDVALWEMAPWTGLPLDGTDPYSELVDGSAENDDIVHACPVGNTGGAQKHARIPIPAGEVTTLEFDNPAALGPTYIQVSLNIRGASDLGVKLRSPDNDVVDIIALAGKQTTLKPGLLCYPTVQTTSRGTYFVDAILYAYTPNDVSIPHGIWTIEVQGDGDNEATLDAYLMDEVSSWSKGVAFSEELSTDESTLGSPAVADHAIGVGAFTGHPSLPQTPWFYGAGETGEVRDYSGRGPRIDGAMRLDIVAPDNPFAAMPYIEDYFGLGEIAHGGFSPSGGTSGAGPHVAGVAVLLAQVGIRGKAAKQAIFEGASKDEITLANPHAYGAGRLDAAGALGMTTVKEPPVVTLRTSPSPVFVGQEAKLQLAVSDPNYPESALVARWDDGYDGVWDTGFESVFERVVVHEQVGRYPHKVRVRNPGGRVAEAIVTVDVVEAPVELPDAGADGDIEASIVSGPEAYTASGSGCGCRSSEQKGRFARDFLLLTLLVHGVFWVRRRKM